MTTATTSDTANTNTNGQPRTRLSLLSQVRFTPLQVVLIFIGLLTALRLYVVNTMSFNLGPDEAQYWSWSTDFAFGYFSKPPMLPWVISITTSICGDGEACIRSASSVFHAGTALMLFALGSLTLGSRVGFWSAILFATLPAVWFSSGIASTDVPLLFFWTLALVGIWQTIERRTLGWAILGGLGLGLALMSKYAAIYLVGGMAIFAFLDPQARKALLSVYGAVIVGLGLLILSPNIAWNMSHDFATVSHTAANANWGAELFNIGNLFKFVGDQFGVFGPIPLLLFFWGLLTLKKRLGTGPRRRVFLFLLAMSLPPLLIVTTQSFISRANANWAATAYPAATILVVAWALQMRAKIWLTLTLVLHLAGGLVLYTLMTNPVMIEEWGLANGFKRVRAWDQIGEMVRTQAAEGNFGRPYTAVAVDDRLVYAELLYYARPLDVPLTMIDENGIPENHFELNNPLTDELAERVLFVTRRADELKVRNLFLRTSKLGRFVSDIGGGRTREFDLWVVGGLQR